MMLSRCIYVGRLQRKTKIDKSTSPASKDARVSDKNGHKSEAPPEIALKEKVAAGDHAEKTDNSEQTKSRIKQLLQMLFNDASKLDNKLESELISEGTSDQDSNTKWISDQDLHTMIFDRLIDKDELPILADAHRLRQAHASAFNGWHKVVEMTDKLNQDVNALGKRVERRRHIEELEPWRRKDNQLATERSVAPQRKNTCCLAEDSTWEKRRAAHSEVLETNGDPRSARLPQKGASPLDERMTAALRRSLLGTNGEPRTARCLKRAVLEQWTRVLGRGSIQGNETWESTPGEETVRMVLDLRFADVTKNILNFSVALRKDVSSALGIDSKRIRILNIEAGSVIVTLSFLLADDGRSALVALFLTLILSFFVLPSCAPITSHLLSVLSGVIEWTKTD